MKYKPYYSHLLILSAFAYFVFAVMDYTITMCAYHHYGYSFFYMEMNPIICFLLNNGIPPVHMVILAVIVLLLCTYLEDKIEKVRNKTMIRDRAIWLMWFSTLLISVLAIIHFLGFYSWFYHGAF